MRSIYGFFGNLFKKNELQEGSSYAVLRGDYYGEIFIFIEEKNEEFIFVSIPSMKVRKVAIDKFKIGIREKIIEFVKVVPKDAYSLLKAHAKKDINDKKIE
jgi:hypothetical protein